MPGRTLVLDGEHVFASANEAGIAIVGRPRHEQQRDPAWLIALRVAVVGVGHLGRHHARILSTLDGVTLDSGRRQDCRIAPRRSPPRQAASALTDSCELLGTVDAVTVAVPTELHRDDCDAVSRARNFGARREADGALACGS